MPAKPDSALSYRRTTAILARQSEILRVAKEQTTVLLHPDIKLRVSIPYCTYQMHSPRQVNAHQPFEPVQETT
jgi:hypothetical protein